MNTEELQDILDREPFQPVRLRLTSGDSREITRPGMAMLLKSRLFIATPDSDHWTLIPFLHIASIETIDNGHNQ
jgi:hypothetical protein